ncbi:hypothetical protein Scani_80760 [Streptomyces caniferus]|uniref:Uncharacterized protein n=1 Tax=Streptomyces caniferus TaxID=285557 RepID=A0A640SL56_9ACTN|nr:hypothetical protein Scani_80760 [Streptomyces caniferus]
MLCLHLEPLPGELDVNEISVAKARAGRAERLKATGTTTVAKSYRLLKAIMNRSLLVRIWCKTPELARTTKKAQVSDLGLNYGAGDGNRTRALSLGIKGARDSH